MQDFAKKHTINAELLYVQRKGNRRQLNCLPKYKCALRYCQEEPLLCFGSIPTPTPPQKNRVFSLKSHDTKINESPPRICTVWAHLGSIWTLFWLNFDAREPIPSHSTPKNAKKQGSRPHSDTMSLDSDRP